MPESGRILGLYKLSPAIDCLWQPTSSFPACRASRSRKTKRLAELTDVNQLRGAYDFGNPHGGDALVPYLTNPDHQGRVSALIFLPTDGKLAFVDALGIVAEASSCYRDVLVCRERHGVMCHRQSSSFEGGDRVLRVFKSREKFQQPNHL